MSNEPHAAQHKKPGDLADATAAHEFLTELRTRISTQPLPYQYGVEARALESLWELFNQARTIIKANPGCEKFGQRATRMLNVDLRPVTAKWHRAYMDGRLSSRDGANDFRADLENVQKKLRSFAADMHLMAYGSAHEDELTAPAMPAAEVNSLFEVLEFGIPEENGLIDRDTTTELNDAETEAVKTRREHYRLNANGGNAVGLGLSGGGIRSATFCLGVVQLLAKRGFLREVDYLSTVSGGGFFRSLH